ncbi:hypothetical protein BD779DRAFT_1475237 [Infundibulicybe gibba]|nr:hypothetical protein BD779DRAFT_1475237 [Infundibulicybe gibba]
MASVRRSTRNQRPSFKIATQYAAEVVEVQAEKSKKRAEKNKHKRRKRDHAAGIIPEANHEHESHVSEFASRPVPSKPKMITERIQRTSKVPPLPLRPSVTHSRHQTPISAAQISNPTPAPVPMLPSSQFTVELKFILTVKFTVKFTFAFTFTLTFAFAFAFTFTAAFALTSTSAFTFTSTSAFTFTSASAFTSTTEEPWGWPYPVANSESLSQCLLATEDGFPIQEKEVALIKDSWEKALEFCRLEPRPLTLDIFKVIRGRGSQLRGEAKTKLIPLVEAVYGFDTGRGRKSIRANRKLAAALKYEKGYLYKSLGDETTDPEGLYKNPIIRKGICALWFTNGQDEGIEYSNLFNPMPICAIALILTAVECVINMWSTGVKRPVPFVSTMYRPLYVYHIEQLRIFGRHTQERDLLGKLRKKLYTQARIAAGVLPEAESRIRGIPRSAFDAAMKEDEQEGEDDEEGSDDGWDDY